MVLRHCYGGLSPVAPLIALTSTDRGTSVAGHLYACTAALPLRVLEHVFTIWEVLKRNDNVSEKCVRRHIHAYHNFYLEL